MGKRSVKVSVVDPVKEAVTAIKDGVQELDVNMWGLGKTDPTLKAVSDYPYIGNDGLKAIVEALDGNESCKVLDLGGNRIGGGSAIRKFAKMLAQNNTLEKVDLSNNDLTSADVSYLADALKTNKSLTFLGLSGNRITDTGVEAIAKALRANTTLKTLQLNHNLIRDDGAEALSKMLTSSALASIALNFNGIRNRGAKALLRKLTEKDDMSYLGIAGNKINMRGAKYCVELFDARKSSSEGKQLLLSIDHNQISAGDLEVLGEKALEARCSLTNTLYVEKSSSKSVKSRMAGFVSKDRVKAIRKGYQNLHYQDGKHQSFFDVKA